MHPFDLLVGAAVFGIAIVAALRGLRRLDVTKDMRGRIAEL